MTALRSLRLLAPLWALVGVILLGTPAAIRSFHDGADTGIGTIPTAQLPAEARETLRLIRSGGPFP
jgi:guanyl-specific ribonuclease Sa